jgi:7-keto-8-aminopelargonate synthetase-like enzyme
LQDRYGLFLYFDDSHGLSVIGGRGEGYVRERLGQLTPRTVVVASLAKAFGACGGMLMNGDTAIKDFLLRYGNTWSQYLNSAGIGGVLGSVSLHSSAELQSRQAAWWSNVQYLDSQFDCENRGSRSPIRVIRLKSEQRAVEMSSAIFERGFYTSAVFFPIVAKGQAGLRVMPRADLRREDLERFAVVLREECGDAVAPLHAETP